MFNKNYAFTIALTIRQAIKKYMNNVEMWFLSTIYNVTQKEDVDNFIILYHNLVFGPSGNQISFS